jgi:hypothetical protein
LGKFIHELFVKKKYLYVKSCLDELNLGGKNIIWSKINKPGPGLKVCDWPEGVPLKPISQMTVAEAGKLEKYLNDGGRPVFFEATS